MSGDGRGGEQDLIGGEQDLINDFEERAPALYNVNHPQEMTESMRAKPSHAREGGQYNRESII